jgi:hypothetical protein
VGKDCFTCLLSSCWTDDCVPSTLHGADVLGVEASGSCGLNLVVGRLKALVLWLYVAVCVMNGSQKSMYYKAWLPACWHYWKMVKPLADGA